MAVNLPTIRTAAVVAAVLGAWIFTGAHAGALEGPQIDIAPRAALIDGGQGIELEVEASCPGRYVVIEAFAYASQPDEAGGGAFSSFSGVPVKCNGQMKTFVVPVRTFEGDPVFEEGYANASTYLLVSERNSGRTFSAGESEVVEIRN